MRGYLSSLDLYPNKLGSELGGSNFFYKKESKLFSVKQLVYKDVLSF